MNSASGTRSVLHDEPGPSNNNPYQSQPMVSRTHPGASVHESRGQPSGLISICGEDGGQARRAVFNGRLGLAQEITPAPLAVLGVHYLYAQRHLKGLVLERRPPVEDGRDSHMRTQAHIACLL